ncbi:MAG TPA: hypothetical protein PLU71_04220 [Candidatus Dependentiae bacterium]|nr:hypothetical protein [Candidatus Dependentiae bacterium]HRQ63038.1 hypothetical protein [Candidatus Dependentiae bacterium]
MKYQLLLFILTVVNSCVGMLPESLHKKFAHNLIHNLDPSMHTLLHDLAVNDVQALQQEQESHIFFADIRALLREAISAHYHTLLDEYYKTLNQLVAYVRIKQIGCTYMEHVELEQEAQEWGLPYVELDVFKEKLETKFPKKTDERPAITQEFVQFFGILQQELKPLMCVQ